MDKQKIGFIQGVAYSAGLLKQYGMNSDQLLKEAGITEEELIKYAEEYDLENLGIKIDE